MITGQNEYTRFMVAPFDERKSVPAPVAFQASFFGIPETGARTVFEPNTKSIEIDIIRARGNTLAQMVNRGTSSDDARRIKSQTEQKFTNVARVWPLAEAVGHINSVELLERVAGETPYQVTERKDRLTMKAMDIHEEHIHQHLTTAEFLARQSILTGEHPAILNTLNSDLIYDFYRNAGNFITAGALWTNVATDIDGDIDAAIDEIQQNSFLHGEYGIIIGSTAFGGFKANTAIRSDADNRRFVFVELGGRMVELPADFVRYRDNGFAPRGYLETTKGRRVWVFTYDLTFIDDFTVPGTDTATPWMPVDQALVFSPKARCDRYFGPPDRLPVTAGEIEWMQERFGFDLSVPVMPPQVKNARAFDPRMFYCDAYEGPDKKSVVIRTQSAMIWPSTQTDAFVTLSGLA